MSGGSFLLMQEHPPLEFLEQIPLGQLVAATRRRIKQAMWSHLQAEGLTPQQYWIVMMLLEHGPHSLHELATRVWIDDPTACRIVKNLAGRGLVVSEPDPKHGRRIIVRLAPGTEPLQKRARAVAAKVRAAIEQGIGEEEKALLRSGLMKVIANMDELEAEFEGLRARQA